MWLVLTGFIAALGLVVFAADLGDGNVLLKTAC